MNISPVNSNIRAGAIHPTLDTRPVNSNFRAVTFICLVKIVSIVFSLFDVFIAAPFSYPGSKDVNFVIRTLCD